MSTSIPPRLPQPDNDEWSASALASVAGEEGIEVGRIVWDIISDVTDLASEPAPSGRSWTRASDRYNSLVREVTGTASRSTGLLAGRKITVKDSIAVAGVPQTAGFSGLEAAVPVRDAIVTERLLSAGAEIVGTTNMDMFGFAAFGASSSWGPTRNPFDVARTAGGSSGGAAASLFLDHVDGALGTDQGGSIRVPASWNGVLGLKPSHGRLSYDGVLGIDPLIDHVGPLARTAQQLRTLFSALQGLDADPRPRLTDLDGLRVGLLIEGFGTEVGIDPQVSAAVRASVSEWEQYGVEIVERSVPQHAQRSSASFLVNILGITATFEGRRSGYGAHPIEDDIARELHSAVDRYADRLSPQILAAKSVGSILDRRYGSELFLRAKHSLSQLKAAYDNALENVDVLVMPTTPTTAPLLAKWKMSSDFVSEGWSMLGNTAPFNASGHPAISLPTSEVEGLPVGTMIVGRHGADDLLLEIALVLESALDWRPAI